MSQECEKWQEEISAYIDGELAEPEKDALEQHLTSCPACRSCLTAYQTVQGVLTGWQTQPPEVLRQGIVYKVQKNKKASPTLWRRWISLGSVAAALLLVVWLANGDPLRMVYENQTQLAETEAGAADEAKMFDGALAVAEPTGSLARTFMLEEDAAKGGDQEVAAPQATLEGAESNVTLYYIYLLVDLPQEELAALPNAEPLVDGSVLIPMEEMEPLLQKWEKESVSNSGKTQIHNAASDKVCLISSQDG